MANGPLGLEHPLVCGRDLDALAARYRAMGFAPTPKGRHPWGTGTQLVMFADTFIELMGIEDRSLVDVASPDGFRFGRFIADFLDRREGIAMLALHSKDARGDLDAVRARGVPSAGLVDFRRAVKLPDGATDEAVVSLAMLIDPVHPQLSNFICQQHRPELVWVADWLHQPNGTTAIAWVAYAAADPEAVRPRFTALWSDAAVSVIPHGLTVATAGGDILVLDHAGVAARFAGTKLPEGWRDAPCAIALGLRTPDRALVRSFLDGNGVPFITVGDVLRVGPPYPGNIVLEFVP
jgi:hypothetical protein